MKRGMKKRLGRCYELSGRFVTIEEHEGMRGITLVHGTIQGGGNPTLDHAWVEYVDTTMEQGALEHLKLSPEQAAMASLFIFDPVLDEKMPVEAYAWFAHAKPQRRYTVDEARKLAVDSGHWGPWEEGEL